jgi:hypothetical protein
VYFFLIFEVAHLFVGQQNNVVIGHNVKASHFYAVEILIKRTLFPTPLPGMEVTLISCMMNTIPISPMMTLQLQQLYYFYA